MQRKPPDAARGFLFTLFLCQTAHYNYPQTPLERFSEYLIPRHTIIKGYNMGQKTMCDWSKEDRIKDFSEYASIVRKPRFWCYTCGRVANKKKNLCKAQKLPKK